MKIMFINPGYSMGDLYGDFAESGNELPPQGLASLAAVTIRSGYDTAIMDCAALKMDIKAILNRLSEFRPDCVGITCTTTTMQNAGFIATEVKNHFPSVKIIVGGAHMTALAKDTLLKFPAIDIGVIGEGEEVLIELLDAIKSDKPLIQVSGIATRSSSDQVVVNTRKELISNIDTLPLPAWNLLPSIKKFYKPPGDSINRMPAVGLVTSRGCPGKCIFCDNLTYGRVFRPHSAGYVLRMIEDLVKNHGVREIYFQDDYFMASKKRLIEICNRLISANLDLTWTCTGRITKSIDDDLLKLMKRAGCWQICYGIESGSQSILDVIMKDINLEEIKFCVAKTRRSGLCVKGFFMLGNFMETEETMDKTIKFIRELPLTDFHMCYFVPYPGSPAYKTADNYGEFNKEWNKANLYTPECFIPRGLTKDILKTKFKRCYSAHYFKLSVIFYYAKKIKDFKVIHKLFVSFIAFLRFYLSSNKRTSYS